MGKQKYILHVYFHLFKNYAENIHLFQTSKRIYQIIQSTENAGYVCFLGKERTVKKMSNFKENCLIKLMDKS